MSSLRESVRTGTPGPDHGVTTVGMDGRIRTVDRAASSILGLDELKLVGRRLADLLQLDDAPGERRYVRPDGSIAWLLVETELHAERDGEPRAFTVHVRDVTGPRTSAEAEHAATIRSRAAIAGSWILDAQGITSSISPGAAAMLGRHPDQVRGRSPLEFVHEADRELLVNALERRRAGRHESYEVRWTRPDGTAVWALMAAAPMHDGGGRPAGSFALVTDVTDRRRAGERLERQASQQEAVAALGRLALVGVEHARLLDETVRRSAPVLGADLVGVFETGTDDRLDLVAVHGLPAGSARDLTLTRDDAAPPADELATGAPVVVPDWELEQRWRRPRFAIEAGVRSTLAVPVVGRRTYGILVAARLVPWAPQPDEVRYLEALANVLAAAQDRSEAEAAGRTRALHDPLTGLPNRTLVLDRIDQALRRDDAGALAVVAVDLDRFKEINDTYGAAAGDEVVCAVADRLRDLVGAADTVARLAGDAFALVCDDLPCEADAAALAGRVVHALRAPVAVAGEELRLTASAGVAVAGTGAESAADLLRDADAALSRAKAGGRDRFELFDEGIRARAVERVRLERDLRSALARGELFVAYQPIVALGNGQVTGAEALVRWRHPERGVVPPGDFIGLAEETGLIREIGAWVLETACAEIAVRHRAGRPLTCHVNLSPVQATDCGLPAFVERVLEETGLPAEALVLELTESSLMEAGEEPLSIMQGIRDLGVRLVLDDFGTGYSSLARLRHFPIDGLKIDRSFIAELDGDRSPADALIVAGIVELARALGLTVVGEGVETPLQLHRLRRAGCRYAQGFLLARPGESTELDAVLEREGLLPAA